MNWGLAIWKVPPGTKVRDDKTGLEHEVTDGNAVYKPGVGIHVTPATYTGLCRRIPVREDDLALASLFRT